MDSEALEPNLVKQTVYCKCEGAGQTERLQNTLLHCSLGSKETIVILLSTIIHIHHYEYLHFRFKLKVLY